MKKNYNPEDSFTVALNIFKLFGMWPSIEKRPFLRYIHRNLGYGFQLFYVLATLPLQIINAYLVRGDIHKLIDSSFLTLTCIVYSVKLAILFFRRKEIENFVERLHQPIFAPRQKKHLLVLKNYNFIGKVFAIVFLTLPQLCCICWIMMPFVDKTKENQLLFAAWYPFDIIKSPNYGITYTIQSILLLNLAAMNSMIDVLILNFYLAMVGQLEILKQDFRLIANLKIGTHSPNFIYLKEYPKDKEDSEEEEFELLPLDLSVTENKCLKDLLRQRLANCMKHYEAILLFINDVTKIFHIGILFQMGVSCFVICVTCFKLTVLSPQKLQFYVIMQYQLCMLIEVFCYTWRGNEIMLKNSELKTAIYECGWTSIPDKEFRKSLCIIMSRMQVSVIICVGRFFSLTFDCFLTILRSAYSFYVVLKQMQTRNFDGEDSRIQL